MPITSLYLKGRFYANLLSKYLMTSFYAKVIGVKSIMESLLVLFQYQLVITVLVPVLEP